MLHIFLYKLIHFHLKISQVN